MALIRWEPLREMEMLRRQMDQLFDELNAVSRGSSDISEEVQAAWAPAIEMVDSDSNFVLRAEIPGIETKDLDIQVSKDAVSISGEHRYQKQAEARGRFRSELRYGKFQRVVPLPAQIHNDQVQADFKDGILTLTLPKLEERQKVVRVNLGAAQPATAIAVDNSDSGSPEAKAVESRASESR